MRRNRFLPIKFPVYADYVIHVEVARDFKKAMSHYPILKKGIEAGEIGTQDFNAVGIHLPIIDQRFGFVFLRPNASVEIIAHESWHALQRMFEYQGIKFDHENTAYHLGYLVEKVYKFVNNKRRVK